MELHEQNKPASKRVPASESSKTFQVSTVDIAIATEHLPLKKTEDGVILVGSTRVPFDTVIHAFREGAAPEEIVNQYPSLQLADVYSAVGYLLRHPQEVDSYLRQRAQQREEIRRKYPEMFAPAGLRDRLLARAKGT